MAQHRPQRHHQHRLPRQRPQHRHHQSQERQAHSCSASSGSGSQWTPSTTHAAASWRTRTCLRWYSGRTAAIHNHEINDQVHNHTHPARTRCAVRGTSWCPHWPRRARAPGTASECTRQCQLSSVAPAGVTRVLNKHQQTSSPPPPPQQQRTHHGVGVVHDVPLHVKRAVQQWAVRSSQAEVSELALLPHLRRTETITG